VDRLRAPTDFEALLDRLERRPGAVAVAVLAIVGACIGLFLHGLPLAAERVARAIPHEAERSLGQQVLSTLDGAVFKPSALPRETRQSLDAVFRAFVANEPAGPVYTLHLRSAGYQANAFALPGGRIVLTDSLVAQLEHEEALLAVIAHEIGHIRERHLLRSVLQNSAILIAIGMFAGDASGATGMILAAPVFLLSGHYSRAFERDADAFAHEALAQRDLSPAWFAYAIGRLAAHSGSARSGASDALQTYLSSHPEDDDREAAARLAADGFAPIETALARRLGSAGTHDEPLAMDDISGCWSGWEPTAGGARRTWSVEFANDGELQMRFDFLDPDGVPFRTSIENGGWALHKRVLATRSRPTLAADASIDAYDTLHTYRVDQLDRGFMRYVELATDHEYLSERVDCASAELEPA
jgi:Zn-dependent protease with chaperone function